MRPSTRLALLFGWLGYVLVPWYLPEGWDLGGYPFGRAGTALALALSGAAPWLWPVGIALLAATLLAVRAETSFSGRALIALGLFGLVTFFAQGFAVTLPGQGIPWLAALLGGTGAAQPGMGFGALLTLFSLLLLLCHGLAYRGFCRGDLFTTSTIGVVVLLIALFIFLPVAVILRSALVDANGGWALGEFVDRLFSSTIWGLGCLGGGIACGVAWNTLVLGVLAGLITTLLGLACALLVLRTAMPGKRLMRAMTVLPIITPPFVIGLALILLFGRAGLVTGLMSEWFGIPRSRWIYGLPGVLLAQVLAFAPIAFLVLMGVVQGIAPSLEEAAQTLGAKHWQTFRSVTWPLLRPGLANAFLLGFVESLADFGNPLVLGGNFEVLSTKIFFAVVGAAHNQGMAAVLSIVLLVFTLGAFWLQQRWLGGKSYTTVSGKGDAGLAAKLPTSVTLLSAAVIIPWVVLTVVIYAVILIGGFVKTMGRDYTPTLEHYRTGFSVDFSHGLFFEGAAWPSLFTTLRRVVLPLLKPALVAALIYSFVRSITSVSAVIFLVSAEYNLSTAYIVGRVEAGEFGLAIAYSSVLIVVMAAGIALIQLGVGERKLGRRPAALATSAAEPAR